MQIIQLTAEKSGLAAEHCKHYHKKKQKKKHAGIGRDFFLYMFLSCELLFLGQNFLLCHRKTLLYKCIINNIL